jgi:hypothetical protein
MVGDTSITFLIVRLFTRSKVNGPIRRNSGAIAKGSGLGKIGEWRLSSWNLG